MLENIKKRFQGDRRGVSILTFGNVVVLLLNFTQGIAVARLLGPESYGVAVLVMTVPNLVFTFFDAHTSDAVVRYITHGEQRDDSELILTVCHFGYLVDLAIASIALLVIYVAANWVSVSIIHRPELAWLLVFYAAALLPRSLRSTAQAILVTQSRYSSIASITIAFGVLRLLAVVGLVLFGYGVVGVVIGNMVVFVAGGLLFTIVAHRTLRKRWQSRWSFGSWRAMHGLWKEFFTFIGFTNLTALLGLVVKQADVVILGYFRNAEDVGIYNLAKSLSAVVLTGVKPLQTVTYPKFSRVYHSGKMDNLRRLVRKRAVNIGVPAGIMVLLLVPLTPYIIELTVGPAYQEAVLVAQILFASKAIFITLFWLCPLYLAAGKPEKWTRFTFYGAIFALATYPLGASCYGKIGMAVAVLFAMTVVFATGLAELRRLPLWKINAGS